MNVDPIKTILRKYLTNKADSREREQVDRWYQQLQQEKEPDLSMESERRIKSEIWIAIRANMHSTMQRKSNIRTYLLYAAASVAIICLFTWYWLQQPSAETSVAAIMLTEVSTAQGEKKQVTLVDGSTLTLNELSIVRFHPDFLQHRYVELLDGDVFFEVSKDKEHPFTVKNEQLTTEVLGTSFRIKALRSQAQTEVTVASGSVRVSLATKNLYVLEKGDLLRYDKKEQRIAKLRTQELLPAWMQSTVVLDDLSFTEMTKIMQRDYDVLLKTNNSHIKNMRFTATLRKDMTAKEAIEVILNIHQLKSKKRRDYVEVFL